LSFLFERIPPFFKSPTFFSDSVTPVFEVIELDDVGLIGVD
jgi:hypothetical protein